MQSEHWNVPQPQTVIRKAACLAVLKGTTWQSNMERADGKFILGHAAIIEELESN